MRAALARSSSSSRSRALRVSRAARSNSTRASAWRAQLREQVAAHAGQQVVAGERRLGGERVDATSRPAAGTERQGDRDRPVQLDDRRRRDLGQRRVERRRSAASRSPRLAARAHGRRRSPPAACTGRARRPAASARCQGGQPAPDQQAIPAPNGPARGSRIGRPPASTRAARGTPGSPSARPGRGPRARRGRAPRGCGRAAAPRRTASGRIQSSPAVAE